MTFIYITLYYIASYYMILYPIISYHIILYQNTSYHIITHHIISYYIILYHIISFDIKIYIRRYIQLNLLQTYSNLNKRHHSLLYKLQSTRLTLIRYKYNRRPVERQSTDSTKVHVCIRALMKSRASTAGM